ncbi:MAG TPA: DUF6298 domain-containing protein [Longimicrobiales bacterium]
MEIRLHPAAAVLHPGEQRGLQAWAIRSDGSREDVTARVQWSSLRDDVAAVSAAGDSAVATAQRPGLTTITAALDGRRAGHALIAVSPRPAPSGPLRLDPARPRYFRDGSGRPVYLTGSHTWSNLQDNGQSDPPPPFDFDSYLAMLARHGHNFMRLWAWEQASWTAEIAGPYWFAPTPYQRTGPGLAADGKPRFDLTKFDDAYFRRLRERVIAAGRRGIYVSIMLFNGWSIEPKGPGTDNPWKGHPYNRANNINGIDGDADGDGAGTEVHQLRSPEILRLQEAYVRRVVDAVNDLDNVLFEISNESSVGSAAWQYHMIEFLRRYEAGLPKQHPIGMTVERPGESNEVLFRSPADWVSPFRQSRRALEPGVTYASKVVIADTDHLCGVCGTVEWVWKSFTRGENPIIMDPYDGAAIGLGARDNSADEELWGPIRRSLGYARVFAEVLDLDHVEPMSSVSSSGYALASPWAARPQYLVFVAEDTTVDVDLVGTADSLAVDWFDPRTGALQPGPAVPGSGRHTFESPFGAPAVLYLRSADPGG